MIHIVLSQLLLWGGVGYGVRWVLTSIDKATPPRD